MHPSRRSHRTSGFTIVELLIVIIIIAILAAITIVAYTGIRQRAIDSKISTDLNEATTKLATLLATSDNGIYPASFSDTGLQSSSDTGGTTYFYNRSADGKVFCLQGVSSGRTFFITNSSGSPATGYCDGTTGVPSDGNYSEEVDLSGSHTFPTVNSTNGTSQIFTVDVPAGLDYVSFSSAGGTKTGTFGTNIRVRQGAAPTSGTKDCESLTSGNYENCYMATPSAGTWYVEVFTYSSDTYADVALSAEWGYFEGALENGQQTISGGLWSRNYYTVNVPVGTEYLNVWTQNGTNTSSGANIAVNAGTRPGNTTSQTANSSCSSTGATGNRESCYIYNPTPGTWHILIFSGLGGSFQTSTYDNVTFGIETGTFEGVYSGPLTLSAGDWSRKLYSYTVPSGVDYVNFGTYGGTNTSSGANVAVRYNALPGSPSNAYGSADCYSVSASNNYDNCFMYNPTPGTWYASVFSSNAAYPGTYANTNFRIETGNWPGAYTGPVILNGGYWYRTVYSVNVPAGQASLTATLSGGTETAYGANLSMKYNTVPGDSTNAYLGSDCYKIGTTNSETCTITNPAAGTWYVMVFSGIPSIGGDSTFNNVTLNVSYSP